MSALTVKDLHKYCERLIKHGEGDKKILISDDDEGNGYHELFFHFSPTTDFFNDAKYAPSLPYNITQEQARNEYIILG